MAGGRKQGGEFIICVCRLQSASIMRERVRERELEERKIVAENRSDKAEDCISEYKFQGG